MTTAKPPVRYGRYVRARVRAALLYRATPSPGTRPGRTQNDSRISLYDLYKPLRNYLRKCELFSGL